MYKFTYLIQGYIAEFFFFQNYSIGLYGDDSNIDPYVQHSWYFSSVPDWLNSSGTDWMGTNPYLIRIVNYL